MLPLLSKDILEVAVVYWIDTNGAIEEVACRDVPSSAGGRAMSEVAEGTEAANVLEGGECSCRVGGRGRGRERGVLEREVGSVENMRADIGEYLGEYGSRKSSGDGGGI